jgi:hypothetical protein
VAEDGSIDETHRIIASLAASNPKVSFLHSPVRLGKGKAVKNALGKAKGDIIVFMDVDLSTSLKSLPQLQTRPKNMVEWLMAPATSKAPKCKDIPPEHCSA